MLKPSPERASPDYLVTRNIALIVRLQFCPLGRSALKQPPVDLLRFHRIKARMAPVVNKDIPRDPERQAMGLDPPRELQVVIAKEKDFVLQADHVLPVTPEKKTETDQKLCLDHLAGVEFGDHVLDVMPHDLTSRVYKVFYG